MTRTSTPLVRPRDAMQVVLYAFGRLVWARLSPNAQDRWAVFIGQASWTLQRRKRELALYNLQAAFGQSATPQWLRRITREYLTTYWIETLDLFNAPRLLSTVEKITCTGLGHLTDSIARGKGTVLYSSALGRRILPQSFLAARGVKLHQVHTEFHVGGLYEGPGTATRCSERWIRPRYNALEHLVAPVTIWLPESGSLAFTRTLTRLLQDNRVVWTRGDAHWGQKLVELPYLGQHDRFPTGMLSLARLNGASVLPVFCCRTPEVGFRVTIEEPLPLNISGQREAVVEQALGRYVSLVEANTRRYPGQYRDWHYVQHYARARGHD